MASAVADADPPTPTEADTAAVRAVLKDHLEWVRSKPDGHDFIYSVDLHIAGTDPDRHFVSYTTANLRPEVNREGPRHEHHWEKTLVGDGTTYFSDRTWQSSSSPAQHPFDPDKQDAVRIAIDVESGTLILTLKSWGDGEFAIPLFASNGVLYGHDGTAMFVLDLKDVKAPVVAR